MRSGVPGEAMPGVARVVMTPKSAKMVRMLGHDCLIKTAPGLARRFSDDGSSAVFSPVGLDGEERLRLEAQTRGRLLRD
jgi:alanine dehydrogenase